MIKVVPWTEWLKAKLSDERGASLAEYALLLFVMAVAVAGVAVTLGADIVEAFNQAVTAIPAESGP